MVETVENQTYRLKWPIKWRIYPVFYVLLLKKDITRKKAVNQKIADQL